MAISHDRTRVVILFDLDGFKLYNDTFGHPAGNSLLQMIGADLRAAVADPGTAYRLGGDEYCAVLTTDADPEALGRGLVAAMARRGARIQRRCALRNSRRAREGSRTGPYAQRS